MSEPLSVTITGWDAFLHQIEEANVNVQPLVTAGLQNSVAQGQRNVRSRAAHKTGSLQRSVLTSVDYPVGSITVDESYGVFVEEGTAPHDIAPKSKKALFWSGAFSPVKSVHHPGTKAQPFFKPGIEATTGYVVDQFTKITERIVDFMAGKK